MFVLRSLKWQVSSVHARQQHINMMYRFGDMPGFTWPTDLEQRLKIWFEWNKYLFFFVEWRISIYLTLTFVLLKLIRDTLCRFFLQIRGVRFEPGPAAHSSQWANPVLRFCSFNYNVWHATNRRSDELCCELTIPSALHSGSACLHQVAFLTWSCHSSGLGPGTSSWSPRPHSFRPGDLSRVG